ncbi:hypothetical protein MCUN1_001597 [Malassezia cuniculi]|uniref:XPG N-terminal domain-containing protein n=1 Tax=Malassezia cuniculi TaxID=948313 RepID=A0AAF0J602_9BASI|nr:hypothetical protein MCUN1_001597 [Malassezia cuniculi]
MRATLPVQGVKGLLRYARVHAPTAFKRLNGLKDIAGLRVAIDATLLTQRFFYRSGSNNATVLASFYQTLTRLRNANIYPILVFDNTVARLELKAYEQLKRRASREMVQSRMELEDKRLARIKKLKTLTEKVKSLPKHTRALIGGLLRQWEVLNHSKELVHLPSISTDLTLFDEPHLCALPESVIDGQDSFFTAADLPPDNSWHIAYHIHALRQECAVGFQLDAPVRLSLTQIPLAQAEYLAYELLFVPEIAQRIAELLVFKGPSSPSALIDALYAKTLEKRNSYADTSRSVSADLYDQAVDLCRMMKIPVFITGDGTDEGGAMHEAEGFASALVQQGYADIVASEDSDVVMYDVPLLRGLGSNDKLDIVCARTLRKELFPSEDTSFDDADNINRMKQFALLCGTDFNRTVAGIGPHRGHALIKQHGDIRTILENNEKYTPPPGYTLDTYLAHLAEALSVFENMPDVDGPAAALGFGKDYRMFPEYSKESLRALLIGCGVEDCAMPADLR